MKKILILGGDHFAVPVVEAAKKEGYYTITCDYLPDNIAHRISDEFVNLSTTDKEGVLAYAYDKKVDGIVTFTDSGVVTAAYVQHHLGLPQIGPLESVEILQNKERFRKFLADHNFNVPYAKGYYSLNETVKDIDLFKWPVIVKPVDSAASKGVSKVDKPSGLEEAVSYALSFSASKRFIIEEFIEKKGCSSDSDCFSIDGKLVVTSFSSQFFDHNADNPFAPSAFCWPSTFSEEEEKYLKSEIQRLLSLLKMKTSIYNIETRVGLDNKPYIMEISPRGGGNRLAEMVKYSTGVDMITAAVRGAVGDNVFLDEKAFEGYWAELILHAQRTGSFVDIWVDDDFRQNHVFQVDLWVKKGEKVESFSGGNKAIGTLVLKFSCEIEMKRALSHQEDWMRIIVE